MIVHALGQGRPDLLGHRLGRVGDGERVGARLADDAEADRRIAVEPEGGIGIFRPLLDPGDVAEADQIAVARRGRRPGCANCCGGRERPLDPQGDVLLRRFEPAGGKLDILACAARSRRRPGSGRSAASRSGCSQIRIAGRASPPMNTRATPSIDGEAVDAGCGRPSR